MDRAFQCSWGDSGLSLSDTKCPVADCTLPIDIALRSSDQRVIGAHKANLEQYSEGFPAADGVISVDGPVTLSEDIETLKLLMQFMHKQKYANLSDLTGSRVRLLCSLGEAAEKYFVYSAMAVCNVHIAAQAMDDPKAAFCYAAKFDYPAVADAAAPHTLGESLESMEKRMEGYPSTVYAWLRYREQYQLVANELITEPPLYVNAKNQKHYCDGWDPYFDALANELPRTAPETIHRLIEKRIVIPDIFNRHAIGDCSNGISCSRRAEAWKASCVDLWTRIRPFHTFLK